MVMNSSSTSVSTGSDRIWDGAGLITMAGMFMASSVLGNRQSGKPVVSPLMIYYGHESEFFKNRDETFDNPIFVDYNRENMDGET
jgi:hypothetical protein